MRLIGNEARNIARVARQYRLSAVYRRTRRKAVLLKSNSPRYRSGGCFFDHVVTVCSVILPTVRHRDHVRVTHLDAPIAQGHPHLEGVLWVFVARDWRDGDD